jgi:hypothetical protein
MPCCWVYPGLGDGLELTQISVTPAAAGACHSMHAPSFARLGVTLLSAAGVVVDKNSAGTMRLPNCRV